MDIKKILQKIDSVNESWDDEDYDYDKEDVSWDDEDYDYDEDEDDFNSKRFRQPGSALHPGTEDDPVDQPCPTCGTEDVLTRRDIAKGYQCDRCADRAEGKMQYESKKPSLKDYFQQISEDSTAGMKPLPVLDPKNKQVGAAVITSKDPTIQKILKGLTPQDVQVVQTMTGQTGTPAAGSTTTQSTSMGATTVKEEQSGEWVIHKGKHAPGTRSSLVGKHYGVEVKPVYTDRAEAQKHADAINAGRGYKPEDHKNPLYAGVLYIVSPRKDSKQGVTEGASNDPEINGKKVDISSLVISGVDTRDYPDFADAYVESGSFEDGTEMSVDELHDFDDKYGELVHELAHNSLFGHRRKKHTQKTPPELQQQGVAEGLDPQLEQQAQEVAAKLTTPKNIEKLNSMAYDTTIYHALNRHFEKHNIPKTIYNRVADIVFKALDDHGRRLTTDPRIQEQGVAESTNRVYFRVIDTTGTGMPSGFHRVSKIDPIEDGFYIEIGKPGYGMEYTKHNYKNFVLRKDHAKGQPITGQEAYNIVNSQQGVAEGQTEKLDEVNPYLVQQGLETVIDFLSKYPTATTLTAGAVGAIAGGAIVKKLVTRAWQNHKELKELEKDVLNWSHQKLNANKNVGRLGGKVAKIIQKEIQRRKQNLPEQGVAEGTKQRGNYYGFQKGQKVYVFTNPEDERQLPSEHPAPEFTLATIKTLYGGDDADLKSSDGEMLYAISQHHMLTPKEMTKITAKKQGVTGGVKKVHLKTPKFGLADHKGRDTGVGLRTFANTPEQDRCRECNRLYKNHYQKQSMAEGYILKKTKVKKTFKPGDPDEYYTSGGADVTTKDTDYDIINNKTGQVVGTASWTTNDYFGPGALKITMKNGATRWLDIWEREKGNPQTAFNRFIKDPKTSKKYKEQGVAEGSVFDTDTTGYTKNDMDFTNHDINQIKKIRAKLLKIPGFARKVSDEKSQLQLAEKIFNLMKRGQTFDSALVLSQRNPSQQGVSEGDVIQGPWSQGKIQQRQMQREEIKTFPHVSNEMELRAEITKFLDSLHNPEGQENDAEPSTKFKFLKADPRDRDDGELYTVTYELINDEHNDSWSHKYDPAAKSIEVKPYVTALYNDEPDDIAESKLNEKWGTKTKVAPSEKGKYKGKTKAELLKRYNKLKKSGPHKKGSKEYGTMRELSFAIRAKSGWGKVKEAERPSDQVDMGAGLGAGRSQTVLESNMKKTCRAAYHEGKSHGLGGHAYTCRFDEGTDEHMHYHKGFKEGLDECYGIQPMRGVVDETMAATVPGMASQAMDECGMMDEGIDWDEEESAHDEEFPDGIDWDEEESAFDDDMDEGVIGGLAGGAIGARLGGVRGAMTGYNLGSAAQDMLQKEGNAFTGALAKTPKGGKFTVGGNTYTDHSSLEEYAFESLDRQLNALLNENSVSEGISVSISKGQQGGHDSVSVTATDAEANNLLALVKNAGMGIFADDHEPSNYGAPVTHDGHADVEDHDSILGIMKKMAGIEGTHDSHDYKQEDDEGGCGCGQTPCGCEDMTEEESEDQMEFEVAEDASEVAMTNADEESEAKTDQALAVSDQQDDEKLDEWANDAMKRGTEEAFTTGDEFMLDTISSGLNKKKSTGQATIPVNAAQSDRLGYNQSIREWKKLAGM